MDIVSKKIEELKPYENNPRINKGAIEYVKNSIKEFGFKVPIVVDKNNVIVAGHTRVLASKELGIKEVPCIVADDLTEEQVKAFRLVDNKVSEESTWDFDKLDEELESITDIDMSLFDFEVDDLNDIDDLYNELSEDKIETDKESITFVFTKEQARQINNYIKDNGKDKIVELIYNFVKGEK